MLKTSLSRTRSTPISPCVGFEVLEGLIADLERYHGHVRRVYGLQLQALFRYGELDLIHQRRD
ncbi:MAG: hypothetical protein MZV64_50540 [Ignavibacteriales bacterium]|nr:hypothetical protein [Ignavibacteriales bacterium]